MGEVLYVGFNLVVIYILVTERDKTRICIVSVKDKMMGFIHIDWVYFVYIMSSCLRHYSVFILNTIGACWIDAGMNQPTCLGRDAYIHDHCREYAITMRFSINCPRTICSPKRMLCVQERNL